MQIPMTVQDLEKRIDDIARYQIKLHNQQKRLENEYTKAVTKINHLTEMIFELNKCVVINMADISILKHLQKNELCLLKSGKKIT